MIVNFTLLKGTISWNADLHQLNSDNLLRHIFINGQLDDHNVSLSYNEKIAQGNIINIENEVIGHFSIVD